MGNNSPSSSSSTSTDNINNNNLLLQVNSEIELRNKQKAKIIKFLGHGGFSSIYLIENELTNTRFALKRIILVTSEQETEALREIRAHTLLGGAKPINPHIAALIESSMSMLLDSSSNRVLQLVFPFYPEGDLTSRLLNEQLEPLNEASCLRIFANVVSAVVAAHQTGVAHCDIKPQNILLKTSSFPVLIDWGSASFEPLSFVIQSSSDGLTLSERCSRFCSAAFRAPELWDVIKGKTIDYRKCDAFSLGCVLYAMLFEPRGFSPFESPTQGLLTLAIRSASVKFSSNSLRTVNDGTIQLIKRLLSIDAQDRPTLSECLVETERLLKEEVDFDVEFDKN
jgi:serine/threonine kinase 16